MLKRDGEHHIEFSLLLIGGHLVAVELLQKQTRMAVYQSLGVALCVLVLVAVQALITFIRK